MRSPEENPEETRDEGNPSCDYRAHCPGEKGRQEAGLVPPAHETDKLQHHDQRTWSCLRQPEAIHHLSGLEPAELLHRLLCDVRQHRIGASACHDRGLAKKKPFLEESVLPSLPSADQENR